MRKSTARTIGIIFCSLIFLSPVLRARDYEAQFFTTNLQRKLDFSRLRRAGIGKIIYRVFQDTRKGGGLYFTNSQFRTLKPALQELITELSFYRLDLAAWMIARKFNWSGNTVLFDYEYDNGHRRMVPKLDLFNPDALKKLAAVYKELASHKIDAILIQDDLMLRYNEGFSGWGRARFSAVSGVPAKEKLMMAGDTPYAGKWSRVKIDQVNTVVGLIVRSCKSVNSAIKVGMNVYYEAPLRVKEAEAWYAHNLRELVGTGLDYIYLMSYHRQVKDEMKFSEAENRDYFRRMVETAYNVCGDKLIVKIQLRDWKTSRRIPIDEIKAYLALVPPQVKRVCFTPVTTKDYDYLSEIIGGAAKTREETRIRENR